jgi:cytoskeletal protein CcmA (bactofilin family)
MFNDKKRPEASLAVHTLLGKGTLWKGEVIAGQNSLRIEGTVEGTITSEGEVFIAPTGHVKGTVFAKHLIVTGRVEGTFRISECLEIHGTGWVEGDVELGSLVVDEGGTLQGNCARRGVPHKAQAEEPTVSTPVAAAVAPAPAPAPSPAAPSPAPAAMAPAATPNVPAAATQTHPGHVRALDHDRHPFAAANGSSAPDPFAKTFEPKNKLI